METQLNSGSRKRLCEAEDKDSEWKRLCLQQDILNLAGLPNELWSKIVPRLGIRDWGRLEHVSKHFQSLLLKYSWTTLESLTIDPYNFCNGNSRGEHNLKLLEIQCNSFPKFRQSFFCASKLLRGIAEKAPKLISLKLPHFEDWCEDNEKPLTALGLLPGLSCPALRKFEFSTCIRSMGAVGEVAQILVQTKETLRELQLSLLVEDEDEEFLLRATDVLQPVFGSLSNLETLSLTYNTNSIGSAPRFNEYLLMNKPKLTTLSLEFLPKVEGVYNYFEPPARALLNSKAKLEKLSLDSVSYGKFLSEYEKQLGSTSAPHPLSSLKRFDSHYHWDLGSDGLRLLRLCPKLEEIYGHGMTRFFDFFDELTSLIRFVASFLNNCGVGDRERVLQLNLPFSQRYFQREEVGHLEELTGPLVKTVQNIPCPNFRYMKPEMLTTVPSVKVFQKRNATFRLA